MLKMQKIRRSVVFVLLFAVSCLWVAPSAYARPTDFFPAIEDVAGEYNMNELGDILPDSSYFYDYRNRVLLMNDIQNRDEVLKALLLFNEEYQRLHAAESVVMYRYYCNAEKNATLYRLWQKLISEVERDYRETWRELAASDNRKMLEGMVSPGLLAQYDGTAEVSDELLAKKQAVQNLTADYWQAIDKDYRVTYKGRSYGFDDLAAISDSEVYAEVYKLLARARNREVGGLLAAVIPEANEYARALGYDGYADYAYAAIYGRDYTPEQAAALHSAVKKHIVPLYSDLLAAQDEERFDWRALSAAGKMNGEQMLALLRLYLPEISDEYAEVFDYMQEYGLADVEADSAKLSASFTSYIPYWRTALLFIGSQSGTSHDLATLVHEFGHFAYYMYEQRDTGYDVGEFHSQGLEMLFLNFADDIFGYAGAAYRLNELTLQLKAVVDGCLYDEFQQQAYALKNPTVEDLNRLFHRLSQEYGYMYLHNDDEAYNWVTTAHTFIQPFYYMSYAVSGLSALELLGRSGEDFEGAADTYLAIATIRENGYRALARKAGLADVFTEKGIQTVAAGLRGYFENVICAGEAAGAKSLGELWGNVTAQPSADRIKAALCKAVWHGICG